MSENSTLDTMQLAKYAAAFLLGAVTMFGSQLIRQQLSQSSPNVTITSFDDCAISPGSRVLESYPARCITADDQSFTQEIAEDEPFVIEPIGAEPKPPMLEPSAPNYTCPAAEWVDCMPGPDQGVRLECTSGYLQWATDNCPGFEGAAL